MSKWTVNRVPVSTHFQLYEFESPDTQQVMVEPELVALLENLRDALGVKVYVDSAYRTAEHNASVGGKSNSLHLVGAAADVWSPDCALSKLTIEAIGVGFPVAIVFPDEGYVHLDIGAPPRYIIPRAWMDEFKKELPGSAQLMYAIEDIPAGEL